MPRPRLTLFILAAASFLCALPVQAQTVPQHTNGITLPIQPLEDLSRERAIVDAGRDLLMKLCIPVEKENAAACIQERDAYLARAKTLREKMKAQQEALQKLGPQQPFLPSTK